MILVAKSMPRFTKTLVVTSTCCWKLQMARLPLLTVMDIQFAMSTSTVSTAASIDMQIGM